MGEVHEGHRRPREQGAARDVGAPLGTGGEMFDERSIPPKAPTSSPNRARLPTNAITNRPPVTLVARSTRPSVTSREVKVMRRGPADRSAPEP
jgi:hypothetical protein